MNDAWVGTFVAMVIRIWVGVPATPTAEEIGAGFISAFILAITVVVVAIPEGTLFNGRQ